MDAGDYSYRNSYYIALAMSKFDFETEAEYSYCARLLADRFPAMVAPMMRENIMKMAGQVKGFSPPLLETATTEAAATAAAETDYCIEDAMRAFCRITTGSGVPEFQSIVGKLPIDDLQTLEKLLEGPYKMKMRSEMGVDYRTRTCNPYLEPEVKAAASEGGGDGIMTKFSGQAIGVMLAKVAGGAVFGAFEGPTDLEPFEKAAGAVGLMSVVGGMLLQDKKPGLSRAMVKFGSVAIALAMIVPMAGNLDNAIMSWIFGALAAAIVAVTATFA